MKAGKPVLCEKPLAATATEARVVVDAEKATGRTLIGLGFMRRFDPSYTDLKAVVASGELGDILVSHCVSRTVEAYPGGDSASTVPSDDDPGLENEPPGDGSQLGRNGAARLRLGYSLLRRGDSSGRCDTVHMLVP